MATTTSPVSISFDYQQDTSAPASTYDLTFTNLESSETLEYVGYLGTTSSSGTYTQATSTVLADGAWRLTVDVVPDGGFTTSFPSVLFGVNQDTIQGISTFGIPAVYRQNGASSSDCQISFAGTFDFGKCLTYLVFPQNYVFDSYRTLPDELAKRFPFIYLAQAVQVKNDLLSAPQTATSTVGVSIPWFGHTTKQLTFISKALIEGVPFVGTIKTILGWILWILLAEAVYLRVIKSHDKETSAV